MQRDIERRSITTVLETRADAEGKKRLTGYAAKYNVMSEDLGFREVLMPGAFDRAIREKQPVLALVNHNEDKTIGRTGVNLTLTVDEVGLRMELEPVDTPGWAEAFANVEAGLWDKMSFAFRTRTDSWRTEDGEPVREVSDLDLYDVSIVARPAYTQTDVHVSQRALDKAKEMRTPPEPEPVVAEVVADPPAVVVEDPPPAEPGVPAEVNEARLKLALS